MLARTSIAALALAALSTTALADAREPTINDNVVATHGDWKVLVSNDRDHKTCSVMTVAKSFSPADEWRDVKPYILVRVTPGDGSVFHTLDKFQHYSNTDVLKATVSGRSGTFDIPVAVIAKEPDIKTVEPCIHDKGAMCVATEGLKGLTRGSQLTLTGNMLGTTEQTKVVYSLIGYTRAVQAMNKLCGNTDKTGWLIVK